MAIAKHPFEMTKSEITTYASGKVDKLFDEAPKEIKNIISENEDIRNKLEPQIIKAFSTAVIVSKAQFKDQPNASAKDIAGQISSNFSSTLQTVLDKDDNKELIENRAIKIARDEYPVIPNNSNFLNIDNMLKEYMPRGEQVAELLTGVDRDGNKTKPITFGLGGMVETIAKRAGVETSYTVSALDWVPKTLEADINSANMQQKEAEKLEQAKSTISNATTVEDFKQEPKKEIKSSDIKTPKENKKTTLVDPKPEESNKNEKAPKTKQQVINDKLSSEPAQSDEQDSEVADFLRAKEQQKADAKKERKKGEKDSSNGLMSLLLGGGAAILGGLFGSGIGTALLIMVAVAAIDFFTGGKVSGMIGELFTGGNKKEKSSEITNESVEEKGQSKGKSAPAQKLENKKDVSEIVEPENLRKPVYKVEPTEKQIIEVNNTGTENAHKAADKLISLNSFSPSDNEQMSLTITPNLKTKVDSPLIS